MGRIPGVMIYDTALTGMCLRQATNTKPTLISGLSGKVWVHCGGCVGLHG